MRAKANKFSRWISLKGVSRGTSTSGRCDNDWKASVVTGNRKLEIRECAALQVHVNLASKLLKSLFAGIGLFQDLMHSLA